MAELPSPSAAPARPAASAVESCVRSIYLDDTRYLALPRPEIRLVARFGPAVDGGADVHAVGTQATVRRKTLPAGLGAVTVRLALGTSTAALGVPASTLVDDVVPLDALWGDVAAGRLRDRLATAATSAEAAAIVREAIDGRRGMSPDAAASRRIAVAAAALATGEPADAAARLGVGERHLRRLFGEATGLSPKAFARLARFRRAVLAGVERHGRSWASIAADTGYYDQAHLIGDFRAFAGVTPPALLAELAAARDPAREAA